MCVSNNKNDVAIAYLTEKDHLSFDTARASQDVYHTYRQHMGEISVPPVMVDCVVVCRRCLPKRRRP